MFVNLRVLDGSLSARRAWIEILAFGVFLTCMKVALRKESVDRNLKRSKTMKNRRVALRKESVDRNPPIWTLTAHRTCRSPQGERG